MGVLQLSTFLQAMLLLTLIMVGSLTTMQAAVISRATNTLTHAEPQARTTVLDTVNASLAQDYRNTTLPPSVNATLPACQTVSAGVCSGSIVLTATLSGSDAQAASSTLPLANVNTSTTSRAPSAPDLAPDLSAWTDSSGGDITMDSGGPGGTTALAVAGRNGAGTAPTLVRYSPAINLNPGTWYVLDGWTDLSGWSSTSTPPLFDVIDGSGNPVTSITTQPATASMVESASFQCCTNNGYRIRIHDPEEGVGSDPTLAVPVGTTLHFSSVHLRAVPSAPGSLQGHAAYTYSLVLNNSAGRQIAKRYGTIGLTIIAGHASIDAMTARTGNSLSGYDSASTTGNCDTSSGSCGATAQPTAQPGALTDDTRVHSYVRCTATQHTSCAPTGAAAATPAPNDAFLATAAPDSNNGGAWVHP